MIVWSASAGAQRQQQQQTGGSTADPASPAAADTQAVSADGSGEGMQDIVVTATRNAQALSKVPISVAAFTQERMDQQGFRTFADVARITPGVQFAPDTGNIVIRGIDGSSAGAGTVGIYLDDTPIQARAFGYLTSNATPLIFDLERVEVLRGPQGTLFGAGAQGGAVRYIAPEPSLSATKVYARAEINAVDGGGIGREVGVAVGAPIVRDVIGVRLSAFVRHLAGYVDRVNNRTNAVIDENANRENDVVLRGAMTIKASDRFTVTPSLLYSRRSINDANTFVLGLSDVGRGRFRSGNATRNFIKDSFILPGLKLEYRGEAIDVIYNGSYFKRDAPQNDDFTNLISNLFGALNARGANVPGIPDYASFADVPNRQRNWTQELRAQSSDASSRFGWVLGVFYQKNKQYNREDVHDPQYPAFFRALTGMAAPFRLLPPDFSFIARNDSSDEQLAAFGEARFDVTDTLKLTGGLRYSKTRFRFVREADGPYNGGFSGDSGGQKESPLTPKATISFQPDQQNLFYATASKGYRIGGSSPRVPDGTGCGPDFAALGFATQPTQYKSDTVWNYEVGSKNALFDNRVKVATSAYIIDWTDIQQEFILPTCAFRFVTNVGKARSTGFDLQADVRVARGLNLGVMLGYTNARFTQQIAGGTRPNGTVPIIIGRGDKINNPTWTGTVSADYTFDAFGQDSYIRSDYTYTGPNIGNTVAQNPRSTTFDPDFYNRRAISYLTARAGTKVGMFDVSVFANNLLNSRRLVTRNHLSIGSPLFTATVNPPRTVGITLVYRQ